MTGTPLFLSQRTVITIHEDQIAEHGGVLGLRDKGLLNSALAQPQAQFSGTYLHTDVYEMAAAYIFHLANNHPFMDGNKRTALAVALTFLLANGYQVSETGTELADLVIEMICEKREKRWMAEHLRQRSRLAT